MEMPPLPESTHAIMKDGKWLDGYTPEETLAYGESCARMAREEERERCAKVCESRSGPIDPRDPDPYLQEAADCAAAIRKGLWGTSSIDDPAYQQEQREKNERMRNLVD